MDFITIKQRSMPAKRHQCEHCQKAFSKAAGLRTHMRTHGADGKETVEGVVAAAAAAAAAAAPSGRRTTRRSTQSWPSATPELADTPEMAMELGPHQPAGALNPFGMGHFQPPGGADRFGDPPQGAGPFGPFFRRPSPGDAGAAEAAMSARARGKRPARQLPQRMDPRDELPADPRMGTLRQIEEAAVGTGQLPGMPRRSISAASTTAVYESEPGAPRFEQLPSDAGPIVGDPDHQPPNERQMQSSRPGISRMGRPPALDASSAMGAVAGVAAGVDPGRRFFAPSGVEVLMLPPLLRLREHMSEGATFDEFIRADGQIRDAIGAVFVNMTHDMAEYIRFAQKTTVFAGLWWAGGGTQIVRELCAELIVQGTLGQAGTTALANAYSMGLIDIAANPTVAVLGILFNGLGGYGYSLMNTYAVLWCTNRALEHMAAGDEGNPLAQETVQFAQALARHIQANPAGGANNNPLEYGGVVGDLARAPRLTDQLGIVMGWAADGFRKVAANAMVAAGMLDQAPQHFAGYIRDRAGEAADAVARVIPEAIQSAAQQAVEEQALADARAVLAHHTAGDPGYRAIRPEPRPAAPSMARVVLNIGEGFLAGVMDAISTAYYVISGPSDRVSSLQRANLRMAQWFAEMYLRHHTEYLVGSAQAAWRAALDRELTDTEARLHDDITELRAATPDIMAGAAAVVPPDLVRRASTEAERRAAGRLLSQASEQAERRGPASMSDDAGVVAVAAAAAADRPVAAHGAAAIARRLSGIPPPSAPPADAVFGAAAAREGSVTPTYEEWAAANPAGAAAAAPGGHSRGSEHDAALEALAARLSGDGPGDLSEFSGDGTPPAGGGRTRRKRVRRKRKTRKGGSGSKGRIEYARGEGKAGASRRLRWKARGGRRTRRARSGGKRLRR